MLGIVALLAAVVFLARTAQRRSALRGGPGYQPEHPIAIRDYGEMDAVIGVQTCVCGARYALRGEGPSAVAQQRVARLECPRCEREVALYFDVSGVPH